MENKKEIITIEDTIDKDSETYCPACGHFVGVYEYCPRCGTYVPKRISIKFFKIFSLSLSIIGIICVYLWVLHRDYTPIKIKDITETMNFAYVRVIGFVTRDARIYYDDFGNPQRVIFTIKDIDEYGNVSDDMDEMWVVAYKHNAKKIIEKNLLPRKGDKVNIVGQIKVRPDRNLSLIIQSVTQFKLFRKEIPIVTLNKINKSLLNQDVKIKAKIIDIRVPNKRRVPIKIRLFQNNASIFMVLWSNVYNYLKDKLKVGAEIEARVRVNEFKGKIQLKLFDPKDVKVLKYSNINEIPNIAKKIKAVNIKEIKNEDIGRIVKIKAEIIYKRRIKPGYKLLVKDKTGKIAVILWDRIFEQFPEIIEKLNPSTLIEVQGKVAIYKGKLQIQPQQVNDIKTIQKVSDIKVAKIINIKEIKDEDIGRIVKIKAEIIYKRRIKPGYKLLVKDKTGKIAVILWDRIFEQFPEIIEKLAPSTLIEVQGKVAIYKGKLQIQPQQVEDVKYLGEVPPDLIFKNIGEIKRNYIGKIGRVKGKVIIKKTIKPGIKLVIGDRTGKIGVILWNRIFEKCKFLWKIRRNVWIEVTGIIAEYRNRLQIQPRKINDIKILEKYKEEEHKKLAIPQIDTQLEKENKRKLEILKNMKPTPIPPEEQNLPMEYLDFVSYLKEEHIGKLVQFKGIILSKKEIGIGLKLLFKDRSGRIDIILLKDRFKNTPLYKYLEPGCEIRVKAKVIKYKGKLELQPRGTQDITVLSFPSPQIIEAKELKDILKEINIGRKVKIKGKIIKIQEIKKGIRLVLEDKETKIDIILLKGFFKDILKRLKENTIIEVKGILGKFKKRFEIKLNNPMNIRVINEKEFYKVSEKKEKKVVKVKNIREIKREYMGDFVILKARVIESYVIPPGLKFVLSDGKDRIELIVRSNLLEDLRIFKECVSGSLIEVKGEVSSYKGRTQLELRKLDDFKVIEKGKGVFLFPKEEKECIELTEPQEEFYRFIYNISSLKEEDIDSLVETKGVIKKNDKNLEILINNNKDILIIKTQDKNLIKKLKEGEKVKIKGSLMKDNNKWGIYLYSIEKCNKK